MNYIDEYRDRFGVQAICRVLSGHGIRIAASTYRARKSLTPSVRDRRDERLKTEILRVFTDNYRVFGARKIWTTLNRAGITVARCTVERLMRQLGIHGVRRGKARRTTIPDENAQRPADLVQRQFSPQAPNRLWVADFTYVPTWSGTVYVAFVIDAWSRLVTPGPRLVRGHEHEDRAGA